MDETDFDIFLRILNEAYAADPAAIDALVCNRVPCSRSLADHPTIQVEMMSLFGREDYSVGLLGVVNGLCEAITGKRVAVKFSEPDAETGQGKILGFTEYQP
jgi:hypothetical protein